MVYLVLNNVRMGLLRKLGSGEMGVFMVRFCWEVGLYRGFG